jgi:nitrate/nitrite transport system permease protein
MSMLTSASTGTVGLRSAGHAAALGQKIGPLSVSALKGGVSLAGAALILGLIWAAAAAYSRGLPGPIETAPTFWELVSDPFYDNGPNDKGIGLQLMASLQRVFKGFLLASVVAIPLGILIGASPISRRLLDPIVQVLRPVSPLAWFPIGLVAIGSTENAAIFVIFICTLWSTVINTAMGVSSIPESHKQVSRVFRFDRWRYLTRVVLPHSLPFIITGLRLSMGIAWLVIVAAEMLSGGTGIGFWIWDSYNALNYERVLSAILIIGVVGLALDRLFAMAAARFAYPEVA